MQQVVVSDIQKKVEDSGMQWATYLAISQQAAEDPRLKTRLIEKLEAKEAAP